jgi:hypothetical protein
MPHEGEDKGNKVQTSSLFFLDSLMLISFQPLFHILDKKFLDTLKLWQSIFECGQQKLWNHGLCKPSHDCTPLSENTEVVLRAPIQAQ